MPIQQKSTEVHHRATRHYLPNDMLLLEIMGHQCKHAQDEQAQNMQTENQQKEFSQSLKDCEIMKQLCKSRQQKTPKCRNSFAIRELLCFYRNITAPLATKLKNSRYQTGTYNYT